MTSKLYKELTGSSIYEQFDAAFDQVSAYATCMLRELGGESETVRVVRESHWAVGWVEWIAIHESDIEESVQ